MIRLGMFKRCYQPLDAKGGVYREMTEGCVGNGCPMLADRYGFDCIKAESATAMGG